MEYEVKKGKKVGGSLGGMQGREMPLELVKWEAWGGQGLEWVESFFSSEKTVLPTLGPSDLWAQAPYPVSPTLKWRLPSLEQTDS